jgi:ParB/RepB/Spo0J family partition protein
MSPLKPIHSDSRDYGRKVCRFGVDAIDVGERHREVREESVETLAVSMQQIGLRTPIGVRCLNDGANIVLITGAHRLAAAKRLGWDEVECIVHYDADDTEAELWEIAENLHRAELTKAQRDEHIRRYAELLAGRKPAQLASVLEKGGRGKTSVASQIATETGVSKDTVRRALNPERAQAEKERRQARQAQQAEWDRHREESRAALNPDVKRVEEAKARNGSTQAAIEKLTPEDMDALRAERDELAEEVAALRADVAERDARLAKFDDMAVQYEKGGFEAIIATKDERIRNLLRQVEDISAERAQIHRSREFWKKQALALGYVAPENQQQTNDAGPADDMSEMVPF